MKKAIIFLVVISGLFTGCGYTTRSALPSRLKTVYIAPFKNNINYTSAATERGLYFPLLEVDIHNAIVDRFLFDGNLRVVNEKSDADLVLEGTLTGYERNPLRYTRNDDVQEYRVLVVTSMVIFDVRRDEIFKKYSRFIGEATYFITGPQATSEESAVAEATRDLAKRIVERIIENW